MKKVFLSVVVTALLVCSAVLAHASSAGIVLTVNPGAWAVRDGKKVTLAVKSEVFKGDELVTDATGRVQVIFADDTTVSLGAATTVAVSDFVFDAPGGKASFSADMAKGMARFVTGKVVEKNRSGFSVTTPQATVGIRGTTFAVNVSPKGVTSVIGLDVKSAFPIAVTNKATGAVAEIKTSGMAVDAAPSGNTSYQTPPGQFSQSSSSVNGKPTAVASASDSSDSGQTSGQASGQNAAQTTDQPASSGAIPATGDPATPGLATAAADDSETASTGSAAPATPAASSASTAASSASTAAASASTPAGGSLYTPELSGAAQTLTNTAGKSPEDTLTEIADSGSSIIVPPPGPTLSASWSGSIYKPGGSAGIGTFSFNTSLTAGSGSMSNARIEITDSSSYGHGLIADQFGSSAVTSGSFDTTLKVSTPPFAGPINAGNLGNIAGTITGNSTSGNWTIKENGTGNDMFAGGPGHFSGSKN